MLKLGPLRLLSALCRGHLRRGWWFEAWTGREAWQRFEVPATECPRISARFLAEEQEALGPWAYRQEYCCQFSETLDQLFSHDVVMASITPAVMPLFAVPEPQPAEESA
jgi:hypothetical protein